MEHLLKWIAIEIERARVSLLRGGAIIPTARAEARIAALEEVRAKILEQI